MMSLRMIHCAIETPDGLIHVQNYVMGLRGQHHVHTKDGFKAWLKIANLHKRDVSIQKGSCDCGLTPSEVKEYDGRKWKSDKF